MSNTYKAVIVVPSIREECIGLFLDVWQDEFKQHQVIVMEDHAECTFSINHSNVLHFSWTEIDKILGEHAWIIPRRTDCIRSFGYYRAWLMKPDMIVTLDDDCWPDSANFLDTHWKALQTRAVARAWKTVGAGPVTRGVPYFNTDRKCEVVLNVGLWSRVPDIDASTQLVQSRLTHIDRFSPIQQVIPFSRYFPMSGMNLAFKSKLTPAMYFLLMGRDYPYDRFGDIWAGLFVKRICDHLRLSVSVGEPIVEHIRKSNVFNNLIKEAPGIAINEELWHLVDNVVLSSSEPIECYHEIVHKISFPTGVYWKKLREAMLLWLGLFT